jgi:hypothetical protein
VLLGLLLLIPAAAPPLRAQAAPTAIEAVWAGPLKAPAVGEIWLRIRVWATDKGYAGGYDSPDQQAMDARLVDTTFQTNVFHCRVMTAGVSYDGTLSADGQTLTGTLKTDDGTGYQLTLRRLPGNPKLRRPQEPLEPYPYGSFRLSFPNPRAGITLAGTLTLPPGTDPFATILLVAGSGPNKRDEEVYGHRPLLVLSDLLTRRGFAVLRYDKRGVGESKGDYSQATTADFADDALAAVEYLKTRAEVDPKRIGIIGHSEGGLVAPLVATKTKDVAFILLMAGPSVSGAVTAAAQVELLLRGEGAPQAQIDRDVAFQKQIASIVVQELDSAVAATKLRAAFLAYFASLPEAERAALGDLNALADSKVQEVLAPWTVNYFRYDPAPTLRQVECPLLALFGGHDVQVPPSVNLTPLVQALVDGVTIDGSYQELPELNHLFQTSATGLLKEYARIEETLAPAATDVILDWVVRQASARGDVNADGKVNIADVVLCLRIVAGLHTSVPPDMTRRADVAPVSPTGVVGDGHVSVADVVRLLKQVAGLVVGP